MKKAKKAEGECDRLTMPSVKEKGQADLQKVSGRSGCWWS